MAIVALVVAIANSAYTLGGLKTKVEDLGSELERIRNRLDGWLDYWKRQ